MNFDYSVVLPCLNEELTLGECIQEAFRGAEEAGLKVEVIVADNGSTDSSRAIAKKYGARVVEAPLRGYGAALDAGIKAAKTELILMGDADCSYSFVEGVQLVNLLRDKELDFVIGNRFAGKIEKKAMPALHRYLGNPVLSYLGRKFFSISIKDFHCGIRAVRQSTYLVASPNTKGMEFATEMIAKFANMGASFDEVPVTLRKDKRNRRPHLRSFPDGWRHLKMMLLFSPQYFLLFPGIVLSVLGVIGLIEFTICGKVYLIFGAGKVQAAIISLLGYIIGLQLISASFISMAHSVSKNVLRFELWSRVSEIIRSKSFSLISSLLIFLAILSLVSFGAGWINENMPAVNAIVGARRSLPIVALAVTGVQGLICSIQVRQILSKFW